MPLTQQEHSPRTVFIKALAGLKLVESGNLYRITSIAFYIFLAFIGAPSETPRSWPCCQ